MFRTRSLFLAFLFILFFALPDAARARQETARALQNAPANAQLERDPRWAAPLSMPGLPNLHKVDEKLYRSAQPEKTACPACVPWVSKPSFLCARRIKTAQY